MVATPTRALWLNGPAGHLTRLRAFRHVHGADPLMGMAASARAADRPPIRQARPETFRYMYLRAELMPVPVREARCCGRRD